MSFERIPTHDSEGSGLRPLMFYASSISAMIDGRPEAGAAWQELAKKLPAPLRVIAWLGEQSDQVASRLLRREYIPSHVAYINIPAVRHFPANDKSGKLTLFDQTAECEVELPPKVLRIILDKFELGMDWDKVRDLDWSGEVFLGSIYSTVYGYKTILLHVENKHLAEKERQAILETLSKLATQGVGARVDLLSPEGPSRVERR